MDPISTLTALALIVEFATEAVKEAVPGIKGNYSRLISIGLGIIICIGTKQGALQLFSASISIPIVDYIITGVLISRGSNLLHDLFAKIKPISLEE